MSVDDNNDLSVGRRLAPHIRVLADGGTFTKNHLKVHKMEVDKSCFCCSPLGVVSVLSNSCIPRLEFLTYGVWMYSF